MKKFIGQYIGNCNRMFVGQYFFIISFDKRTAKYIKIMLAHKLAAGFQACLATRKYAIIIKPGSLYYGSGIFYFRHFFRQRICEQASSIGCCFNKTIVPYVLHYLVQLPVFLVVMINISFIFYP